MGQQLLLALQQLRCAGVVMSKTPRSTTFPRLKSSLWFHQRVKLLRPIDSTRFCEFVSTPARGRRPGRPAAGRRPGRRPGGHQPRKKKHGRANRGRASQNGACRIASDTSLEKGPFHPEFDPFFQNSVLVMLKSGSSGVVNFPPYGLGK